MSIFIPAKNSAIIEGKRYYIGHSSDGAHHTLLKLNLRIKT